MDENVQKTPSGTDPGVTPVKFWGTIVACFMASLLIGYYLVTTIRQPASLIGYIAIGLFLLLLVMALSGILLTIRKRQEQGIKVGFLAGLGTSIAVSIAFQGRTLSASIAILLIGLIVIFWLLPAELKRRYLAILGAGILSMWVVEWINPPWRMISEAATLGPAAAILLGLIVVAIVIRQAWVGNIRVKLVTAFTVVALIAIGIATFISSQAGARIEANADNDLRQNNETLTTSISAWLEFNVATLQEMVLQPDVVNMQAEKQRPVLQAMAATHPYMYLVSTTDLSGMNIARNDDAKPTDYSDRFWFINVKAGAPLTFQSLIGRTTGQPALVVSVPIQNTSGKIVGVGMFAADLTDLSEQTRVRPIGKTGYIYVVDDKNMVLAHPDPVYTTDELKDFSTYPPVAALRQGQTGLINFTDEQGIRWRAYTSILNNGWGIIAQQQEREILASVRQFQGVAIAVILAGAVAMLFLSWFTIRRTLLPINALTSTAVAIAAGDIDRSVKIESQDELGILASAFNNMTAQLRNLIGTLEQRVAERTQSLELAAEVGRSVSQVRALDAMLKDAVELIRSRFDLYYTQVYLVNPTLNTLALQAGTGAVGAELVGRGHRLPLDPGSINGRAAVEKRSVVIPDTAASATFKPNPLLPETRSEMAVPLLVSEKVVGVLDMQSDRAGALSQEMLPAFEALAGQLAVAIQNASLLAEAEQARAEVEKQARRLARTHWIDYMDAIHTPERLGFAFENNRVVPLEGETFLPPAEEGVLSAPIAVTGEPLGSLAVELPEESRTPQNVELIRNVARQVAQQIENLRLLESAERYRVEAEQAARRLTREGWTNYMDAQGKSHMGYLYNLNEVQPVGRDEQTGGQVVTLPLKVRDEALGKLAIQGIGAEDKEALELANAVAERLGAHIESLRQYDQTQSALTQTEKLSEASLRFTQAADLQELVRVAVEVLAIPQINRALLEGFTFNANHELESVAALANWWNGEGHEPTLIGTTASTETMQSLKLLIGPETIFSNDILNDPRIESDPATLDFMRHNHIRSLASLPLFTGNRQIGSLLLMTEEPHIFSNDETRLFTAMGPQIATVVENRRQFERTQKQAEREATLNVISQKIQGATSVESVLQIAARELGHALGAPLTIAQLGLQEPEDDTHPTG